MPDAAPLSEARRAPPAELLALAVPYAGEPASVADVSWDHGESAVWRVAGPAGVVALKAHRQRRKFEQELTAYRDWLPLMRGGAASVPTPRLLAHRDALPRGIVVSWEPGTVSEVASLAGAAERSLHGRAGAFLRALHELPYADLDALPLDRAYADRLAAWTLRARDVVPASVVADVGAAVAEALPTLARSLRVRCHRDYTPRNWLAGSGGELVVIDFEHARPDLRLADLERLWTGAWRRRPDLRQAFLAGYGRDLTDEEEETLGRVAALGALSTVVWAREHGDAGFERHGWETLAWLGLAGA